MSDTETRLTRAELQIEHSMRLHSETQETLKSIAEAVQKLAQAEVRREQDQETFGRIFKSIDKLREDFEEYKESSSEKELAAYKGIVWKLLAMAALVISSLIAGHFGGKLLG